jgi:UDP-N-acetylglucosamine 2-epimerase (non-hydrolysing)
VADLLFTPSRDADENLLREGVSRDKIHFVGNVMIDTLLRHRETASRLDTLTRLNLSSQHYALVTLHRPSNVDDPGVFGGILGALHALAKRLPVVFPIHPRSRKRLEEFGFDPGHIRLIDPLGYLEFLNLTANARLVLTDSGGLQEETTILGVPCLTLRNSTERPVTIQQGTNTLVGTHPEAILTAVRAALESGSGTHRQPELWDGHAATRVVETIERVFHGVQLQV